MFTKVFSPSPNPMQPASPIPLDLLNLKQLLKVHDDNINYKKFNLKFNSSEVKFTSVFRPSPIPFQPFPKFILALLFY